MTGITDRSKKSNLLFIYSMVSSSLFRLSNFSMAQEKLLNQKREDDTIESINKRFDFFDRSVMPVIDYYEGKSKYKLIRIYGEQSVEAVHREILGKVFK